MGDAPSPTASEAAATPTAEAHNADETVQIALPAIGLDIPVAGEGLSQRGTIDPDPGTVMWFTGYNRVLPGDTGTAVVAGHVVSDGRPDVFADLAELKVGDDVTVTGADETLTYEIIRVDTLSKEALAADVEVWGDNTTVSRIALVTCDDALGMRDDGHRVANFVAIAELQS
ncbi:MAG: class F sortase [Propioniciclava sp.]